MKVSESLRIGTMMIGPVHGPAFETIDGQVCGCAAGTLYAGTFGVPQLSTIVSMLTGQLRVGMSWEQFKFGGSEERLKAAFPELSRPTGPCPVAPGTRISTCSQPTENRLQAIVHLFEEHGWTRERIADWYETLERADEAQAQEAACSTTEPPSQASHEAFAHQN